MDRGEANPKWLKEYNATREMYSSQNKAIYEHYLPLSEYSLPF